MPNTEGLIPWKAGQSGNPNGRPKVPEEVKELARCYTRQAIETQAEIMADPDAPPAARVSAAENILNRAWGKPEATTNVNLSGAQALVEILRAISERRAEMAGVASGVVIEQGQPAQIRDGSAAGGDD